MKNKTNRETFFWEIDAYSHIAELSVNITEWCHNLLSHCFNNVRRLEFPIPKCSLPINVGITSTSKTQSPLVFQI